MKLELKHLAPYLPYGLKFSVNSVLYPKITMTGFRELYVYGNYHGTNLSFMYGFVKPILRPLSDLTKEITHNGQTFVPMKWMESNINKSISFYQPLNKELSLEIEIITENYSQTINLYDGYICTQKLQEWHFDVFGLIEKGLAIDINTLNK
jgi:hypothetical protein